MAANLAAFRTRFYEFDTTRDGVSTEDDPHLTDALIEQFIADAKDINSKSERVTIFCAAHLLRLELDRRMDLDTDGESSEITVGPLGYIAVPQAKGGEWEAFFTRTEYGRQFLIYESRHRGSAIAAQVVG